MKCIEQLISALAYATFDDSEIEQAVEKHLRELDTDLDAADYKQGILVDKSQTALEDALNTVDSRVMPNTDDEDDDEDDTE